MNTSKIKEIALANGFSLKQQASGNMDLHSYVYEFAEAVIKEAVKEAVLQNDCMIQQTWFMKGTPVSALIKHAENVYQSEAIAQNSKIEFGTDDNEHWFAHDVPYFGRVQISKLNEDGFVEWDICLSGCWQGPFSSKARCIQHLQECIQERNEEVEQKS
ncbi:hypothetical protein F943_01467 [Acinetobacter ursingii NIPH 706]|uniref:hypothetical protein n=1 Tax=Acinetobacter ursingii TaxID=108980 RepID=UPI0002D05480|nr:hypothetical protein [Acinetobacter ursingii]ENX49074.1 hypothetical protein F943_01467 [Acinetobacter ursingii NIPH 706]